MQIQELKERVKAVQQSRGEGTKILDLSNVDLTHEQFKKLIPEIKKIPNLSLNLSGNPELKKLSSSVKKIKRLKNLNLSNCGLTSLPESLKNLSDLEKINLDNNKFEVFPKEICNVKGLTEVVASNNKIKNLPTEIERLNELRKLVLTNNKLESLPDSLLNKPSFIDNLSVNAYGNPDLSRDVQRNLRDNFVENQYVDIARTERAQVSLEGGGLLEQLAERQLREQKSQDILNNIYGPNGPNIMKEIKNLDLDRVNIESVVRSPNPLVPPKTVNTPTLPADIMLDMISKTPVDGLAGSEIYLPAVKKLIDDSLNKELPKEERQAVIGKVATSLGNCATPVRSFLTQVAVGEKINSGEELSELFKGLVTNTGFEDLFKKEFKEELKNNKEAAEFVAALSNLVFLENVKDYEHHPFKVKEDVVRLPSASQYADLGFALIKGKQSIENKFVELCCKTDENGKGIKEEDGSYTIAPEKYNAISEKKFAELGIISEREKKVNTFEKEMQNLLLEHDLASHYDKPDVVPFLDVNKLKNELRVELQAIPDKDINEFVSKHTQANVKSISDLGKKYQENEKEDMSLMMKSSAKATTDHKKQEATIRLQRKNSKTKKASRSL